MSHVPWLHPEQLLWHPSLWWPSPCPLSSPPPASPDQTSGWGWPGSGTPGCSRMRWQNCTAGEGAVEGKKNKKKFWRCYQMLGEWVSHCAFQCFALWHSEFVLSRWQSSGCSSRAAALLFSSTKWWQCEGTNHQQLIPKHQKELPRMQVNTAMLQKNSFHLNLQLHPMP